jgi:hypothetical protein
VQGSNFRDEILTENLFTEEYDLTLIRSSIHAAVEGVLGSLTTNREGRRLDTDQYEERERASYHVHPFVIFVILPNIVI